MMVDKTKSDLPNGWVYSTLGDIGFWTSGGTPLRSRKEYYNGKIPWVKSGDLNDHFITSTQETITKFGLKNSSAKLFDPETLLVALYGATIGKLGILKIKAATNQACAAFRTYGMDNKYIFYYLLSERESLIRKGQGGAQPNISQSILKKYDLPLSPLNEQKRIVIKIENLFDRLNKTKQELTKIPPLLKKFRQSVLAKAFSGELTKEWRDKQKGLEPASVLLERIPNKRKKMLGKKYKEFEPIDTSDLPELPEEWIWGRVGECCLVNPRHRSDILLPDAQISFVPMPAIDAAVGAITKPETKPLKKVLKGFTHFVEGDVLFAKITPCMENGKAAIAKDLTNGIGCGTTELHVLRPLGGISSEYIYYYVRQQTFRDRAQASMTGTAGQLRVPVDFMKNELLPMPPLKEQKEIIKKINNFLAQAEVIEKSVKIVQAHCEKLIQSILAKAFRGELVEQDPNDEPAEELLERLKSNKPKKE